MEETTPEPQKTDKKARNRKVNKILLPIVGVLLLVIVISAAASGGPSKKAKYTAWIDISNASVINPATLGVGFHVKNVGDAPGAPTCTIQVGDVNYTYDGTDQVTLGTVQPGQTVASADNLTITKQGAQYVTTGTINCN